jgi:hypothetical protein
MRWGREALRFCPVQRDRYAVRGNTHQILYRGERESHRFTILDADHFEYDVILKKSPESNVITLFIEGAERYDFFRQPDFINDPLLAGSYAVYKKETLIGNGRMSEGTGKLCHIHRPEIIDSRGRRCRGDLSISVNRLCITIPETWLSEAKYPVVVDPVIGLSALGAIGPEDMSDGENSYWGFNDEDGMYLSNHMGVNQFTAPHAISGNCTAHLYVDYYPGGYHWSTTQDKIWPVIYTHDYTKDRPANIKSNNGGYISNDVGRSAGLPRGWRSTNITVDGTIQQGKAFWFGFHFWMAQPRFDYGGRLYRCFAWPYQTSYAGIRQKFYNYPMDIEYDSYEDEEGNEIEYEMWVEPSYELKISMYLEYTGPPANYTRTLTQGVRLADTRKLTGTYKRTTTQTVRGVTVLGRLEGFYRKCVMDVKNTMLLKGVPFFIRTVIEQIRANMSTGANREIKRDVESKVTAEGGLEGKQGFFRNVLNLIHTGDSFTFPVLVSRLVCEWLNTTDTAGHRGEYLRGLFAEAGSIAEAAHRAEYYRTQQDVAHSKAVPLRHLFVFIRLLTGAFIRDYIIGQFLKSREEVVIKSAVCREITLESKI